MPTIEAPRVQRRNASIPRSRGLHMGRPARCHGSLPSLRPQGWQTEDVTLAEACAAAAADLKVEVDRDIAREDRPDRVGALSWPDGNAPAEPVLDREARLPP